MICVWLVRQIWDIRAGHSVRSIFGPYIAGDAVDVHGNTILTGSHRLDSAVQTWDIRTCKQVDEISWNSDGSKRNRSMLYSAQFSKDGTLIAAGGYNQNMAKVFDRNAGNAVVGSLAGLTRGVFSVDFGKDNQLAVAGGDAAVRLFDIVDAAGHTGSRELTLQHHQAVADGEEESKK